MKSKIIIIISILAAITIDAASQKDVTFTWDANPSIQSVVKYIIYVGDQPGSYDKSYEVVDNFGDIVSEWRQTTNTAYYTIGMTPGDTYYAVIQAVNSKGIMSDLSPEITNVVTYPAPMLSVSDKVVSAVDVQVMLTPAANGEVITTKLKGSMGIIQDGPINAGGNIWWSIAWAGDTSIIGWCTESQVIKILSPKSAIYILEFSEDLISWREQVRVTRDSKAKEFARIRVIEVNP